MLLTALATVPTYGQQLFPTADVEGEFQPQRMEMRLQKTIARADSLQLMAVVVSCDDALQMAERIKAEGHRAAVITPTTLTVRATADYIGRLGRESGVRYVQQSRQMQPMMASARQWTGTDRVHSGDGLETPFTGKGVLIGIIDQGFEFRHVAFLDDGNQPRVKAIWNRKGYSEGKDSEPTTTIPATGDGITSTSHATHVAGIAAGSRFDGNDWYGMAPEADIVMIPSEFNSAEVLEDIRYIADMARGNGQPWVVNLSFGSDVGPHDDTDPAYTPLDRIITEQPGGMIVAAVGNDGLTPIHVHHTFDGDTADSLAVNLLADNGYQGVYIDLWCDQADGKRHLSVRPFILANGTKIYLTQDIVRQILTTEVAPYNRKQHISIGAPAAAISSYGTTAQMGLEVKGPAGTGFHAWTTTQWGNFATGPDDTYAVPDNAYTVCEPAYSMPHAVVVAAYNSTESFTNINGVTQQAGYGSEGDICTFSNCGPALHGVPQPTVTAPGSMIISSVSKYASGFSRTAANITADVKRGLKHFYYGAYAGTSMATPMVTGSVALWLQANPTLTHEQIRQIIQQTAVMPEGVETDGDGWNARWGYGKLKTYEGLKMALQLRCDNNAIRSATGSTEPCTLSKESACWRILFNNDEPWACITLTDMGGTPVVSRRLMAVGCGQETVVSFDQLPAGVYLLQVQTARAAMVRKLMVSK